MIRGGMLIGLFSLGTFVVLTGVGLVISFSTGSLHWPSVVYGIVSTIFVLRISDGVRAAWREHQTPR